MFNVVLVHPEIPHNTGSAGRLALATGARLHLVRPLGFSLDDKRTELNHAVHEQDNIPDIVSRWAERAGKEMKRARTEQSFTVPKKEIAANDYDLSVSRYREVTHEQVRHTPPAEIIAELKKIEAEIADGLEELEGMLK